jgi:hypothetical protein
MQVSQVAMVVRDLQLTMERLHETLGWGPWKVYEHAPPRLHDAHVHGEAVEQAFLAAECEVQPGFYVELVQPGSGPSIYHEWLVRHGEGIQHIACFVDTEARSAAFRREWEARGIGVIQDGRLGDTVEYYYLDTEPYLSFILESGSGPPEDMVVSRYYPER